MEPLCLQKAAVTSARRCAPSTLCLLCSRAPEDEGCVDEEQARQALGVVGLQQLENGSQRLGVKVPRPQACTGRAPRGQNRVVETTESAVNGY
jgi:hypothetical protein